MIMFMFFCSNRRTISTTYEEVADAAVTSKLEVSGIMNLIFKYYTIMFMNQDTAFYRLTSQPNRAH
jgi:hypothetical protein